jgi:transcription factor 7-like 2
MMPPPPALLLAEAAHGKVSALCPNGALDLPPAALQPPIVPSSSLAQPSTSSLHSHNSLAGTQPQPLSLVTKSLE